MGFKSELNEPCQCLNFLLFWTIYWLCW